MCRVGKKKYHFAGKDNHGIGSGSQIKRNKLNYFKTRSCEKNLNSRFRSNSALFTTASDTRRATEGTDSKCGESDGDFGEGREAEELAAL